MHRHSLSSLPSSHQLCFFVSPRLLLPHQKAETEERLRVGDKSVFAVSCGLGKAVRPARRLQHSGETQKILLDGPLRSKPQHVAFWMLSALLG